MSLSLSISTLFIKGDGYSSGLSNQFDNDIISSINSEVVIFSVNLIYVYFPSESYGDEFSSGLLYQFIKIGISEIKFVVDICLLK